MFRPQSLLVTTLLVLAAGVARSAETPTPTPDPLADAKRAVEAARLRLRLFERVDYPLRLQELDGRLQLTRAEIESLRRRIAEYERFDGSKALFLTLEETRLQLLDAELRWKQLDRERLLLQFHYKDERRLRQLLIEQAEQRFRRIRELPDPPRVESGG